MRKNTQIHWIAEAEARCLRETALSHRARREPPIGIVWAQRRAGWSALLQRLMARLFLSISREQAWRWSIYEGVDKRDLVVKPQRPRPKA